MLSLEHRCKLLSGSFRGRNYGTISISKVAENANISSAVHPARRPAKTHASESLTPQGYAHSLCLSVARGFKLMGQDSQLFPDHTGLNSRGNNSRDIGPTTTSIENIISVVASRSAAPIPKPKFRHAAKQSSHISL
jgi:hypothetical protein